MPALAAGWNGWLVFPDPDIVAAVKFLRIARQKNIGRHFPADRHHDDFPRRCERTTQSEQPVQSQALFEGADRRKEDKKGADGSDRGAERNRHRETAAAAVPETLGPPRSRPSHVQMIRDRSAIKRLAIR